MLDCWNLQFIQSLRHIQVDRISLKCHFLSVHNPFRYRQGLLTLSAQSPVKPPLPVVAGPINIPTSPLAHHNYTWAQQSTVRVPISIDATVLFQASCTTVCADNQKWKRTDFYFFFSSEMQMSPQKHVRLSPRPSTSYAPYPSPTYTSAIAAAQHNVHMALGTMPNSLSGSGNVRSGSIGISNNLNHSNHHHHIQHHPDVLNLSHSAPASASATLTSANNSVIHRSPLSPNRRPRGENKKCRKQYGMEKKDLWCTQCKWKKACSRFGDWKRPKFATKKSSTITMWENRILVDDLTSTENCIIKVWRV